jgi:hypothetical protein
VILRITRLGDGSLLAEILGIPEPEGFYVRDVRVDGESLNPRLFEACYIDAVELTVHRDGDGLTASVRTARGRGA